MAVSLFSLLPVCLLTLLIFLHHPLPSKAKIRRLRSHLTGTSLATKPFQVTPPTVYFEVTKPINIPDTQPCVGHILQHDFGYTYGQPPVLANYTPPSNCRSRDFAKIVLEWNATCKGRQYDRIFGVWLGGVELLRSCTAEPRATGIFWTVQKDITRYKSLLLKNETQDFAVYLGNVVDRTYTGVYHVNITVYYYPAERKFSSSEDSLSNLAFGHHSQADLILPISRNLPLNDGLWFEIENSTDTESKEFTIPQNVYRAVLEVYVSFHEDDEFWYSNFPNDYINANNLTGADGNGPFREVVVSVDGQVVGAIWPFTVIYTGGINPLLWRPITGIGSFDLPSYDIELTPLLGSLLDGNMHNLGFSVTNALNVWYIDANLHLWLDHKRAKTEGEILEYENKPLAVALVSNFTGLDGTFLTSARRSISSHGRVNSSHGEIITYFSQHFSFSNWMDISNDGNLQIVNQTIDFNDSVSFTKSSSYVQSFKSFKNFPLYMYYEDIDKGNGTSLAVANLTLGFNERNVKNIGSGFSTSSLKNVQNAQGVMVVKNNLVVSGIGSTQQVYKYDGNRFCYFRNVSSSNYTILYNKVSGACNKRKETPTGFGFSRWWQLPARRASLRSEIQNDNVV